MFEGAHRAVSAAISLGGLVQLLKPCCDQFDATGQCFERSRQMGRHSGRRGRNTALAPLKRFVRDKEGGKEQLADFACIADGAARFGGFGVNQFAQALEMGFLAIAARVTSAMCELRYQRIQIRERALGLIAQGAVPRRHFSQGEVVVRGLRGMSGHSFDPRQCAFDPFNSGKHPVIAHGHGHSMSESRGKSLLNLADFQAVDASARAGQRNRA